jgi:Nif11 domain
MATSTVVQFMQKTAEDRQLREQLENLLGVGDGDISNEAALDQAEAAALKGDRAPMVAEFAAQYGYEFSADDLATVVDALEKHHAGELSDQVFTEIVGTAVPKTLKPSQRLLKYLSKTYLGY